MDANIQILKLTKGFTLIVLVSLLFACSKADESVPMASANQNYSTSFTQSNDAFLPSTLKTSEVVGGDDNEDDDDNRGSGSSHTRGK